MHAPSSARAVEATVGAEGTRSAGGIYSPAGGSPGRATCVQVVMLSCGVSILYSNFMGKDKVQERMPMKARKLWPLN